MEKLISVAENFKKKEIPCRVFTNQKEALTALLEAIPRQDKVAFGGSMTLHEMGAYEALQDRGQEVLWHWRVPKEDMAKVRRAALDADIYLTSSNAVIQDGRLLNIDGIGNRVAAMFFGPPRVIVIAGKNKLAADYDAALERIHTVACPKNAERLKRDVPCRYTGRCQDCHSPQRMCQITVTISNRLDQTQLEVWLVDEDLGY